MKPDLNFFIALSTFIIDIYDRFFKSPDNTKVKRTIKLLCSLFVLSFCCYILYSFNIFSNFCERAFAHTENSLSNNRTPITDNKADLTSETPSNSQNIAPRNSQEDSELIIKPESKRYYSVEPIPNKPLEITPSNVITFTGEISQGETYGIFTISPSITGTYIFWVEKILDYSTYSIEILESDQLIGNCSDLKSDGWFYISLLKGKNYTIKIFNCTNIEQYSLKVGVPKDTIDISRFTSISDDISFVMQQNHYHFTPQYNGNYHFSLSSIPQNSKFKLEICDSLGNAINSLSVTSAGQGLTCYLSANQAYTLRISQSFSTGNYILNIGQQKKPVDVLNFTSIKDRIQFLNQTNVYSLSAENPGVYRFDISNCTNDTSFRLELFNSNWELLYDANNIGNDWGINTTLEPENDYYICVCQYNGISPYTLNIHRPQPIADISNYTSICDSITFISQENTYEYIPDKDKCILVNFSHISNNAELIFVLYDATMHEINRYNFKSINDQQVINCKKDEVLFFKISSESPDVDYTLFMKSLTVTNSTANN